MIKLNTRRKAYQNPLRWLIFIAIVSIIFDAFGIVAEVLNIVEFHRGKLFVLAPFRILFMAVFLYFVSRRSKYAWHIIVVTLLIYTPAYFILHPKDFSSAEYYSEFGFTLLVWIGFLIYAMMLRKPYMEYLSFYEKHKMDGIVFPVNLMDNEEIRDMLSLAIRKLHLSLKLFIATVVSLSIATLLALAWAILFREEGKEVIKTIIRTELFILLFGTGITIWSFVSAFYSFLGYRVKDK